MGAAADRWGGGPSGTLSHVFHSVARVAVARARSVARAARRREEALLASIGAHTTASAEGLDFDKHIVWSKHALEAIVMSAAALEAGINETAYWYGPMTTQGPIPDDFDGYTVEKKWYELPRILGRPMTFEKGGEPWQSFVVLIEL